MVIVVTHMISALYLHWKYPELWQCNAQSRRRLLSAESMRSDSRSDRSLASTKRALSAAKRFLTPLRDHHSLFWGRGSTAEQSKEDAFLPLLEAKTVPELKYAIRKALKVILPQEHVAIFIKSPDSGLIEDEGNKLLPREGIIWQTFQQPEKVICSSPPLPDPFSTALGVSEDFLQNQSVFLLPIRNREDTETVGIIVTSLHRDTLTNEEEASLRYLSKQVAVCHELISRSSSKSKKAVCDTDPTGESLIRLCGELYDQDAASLQIKVIRYLQQRTNAQTAFLLLVVPETQELFCQVIGSKVLEEEVRFSGPHSSFAVALEKKHPLHMEDILPERIAGIEEFLGQKLESFLSVPVRRKGGEEIIALACAVNKKSPPHRFTNDDIQAIHQCFRYTAPVLTSTLAFQYERKLKDQTQALLNVAKKLFTRLDDLSLLLREIMQEARNLTHAERCSVFLIDPETDELVAKVFDGVSAEENEVQKEIRLPKHQGIAGHVATTGNLLNIRDAYSHPLFYRGIDDSTGFRTRNILCFPIKDDEERVIGVAQLCNKKTAPCFTQFDEDIASAFAVYCCISISHSLMYQRVNDAQYRNSLANELMMYHMKVPLEETEPLIDSEVPSVFEIHPQFDQWSYTPRSLAENDTPVAVLSMFEDLGFISRWRIKRDTLARFILMVRRGYRNPPYHNWMHAYAVAHFCYLVIKRLNLQELIGDIEVYALFVACLCHDIDHRGTTNTFQVQSQTVLAALYSSEGSVMERHHFAQSMCIINTEGCNIFESLSSKDYQTVLDLMRDIILATDLAHHLRILKSLEEMARDGYNASSPLHRKLLLCLMMTSCDLSDQTKNWNNTKNIAAMVYQEFFSQGDLEKALGKNPMEMMDRERACIPDLQISFLDGIALPVYKTMAELFPSAQQVYESVLENRRRWVKIGQLLLTDSENTPRKMTVEQIIALEDDDDINQPNGR